MEKPRWKVFLGNAFVIITNAIFTVGMLIGSSYLVAEIDRPLSKLPVGYQISIALVLISANILLPMLLSRIFFGGKKVVMSILGVAIGFFTYIALAM